MQSNSSRQISKPRFHYTIDAKWNHYQPPDLNFGLKSKINVERLHPHSQAAVYDGSPEKYSYTLPGCYCKQGI